ncbi:hypothetical protein ATANTOWER_023241 [Ataeniobius toweri]|uniref:Reverse transcriptase n=1 Tax=Ataeniobius toweri TaxID=208326 RepID=A0ABU7B1L9_9TELE|nr:hypothetical protein [Ataeniobius toweri]
MVFFNNCFNVHDFSEEVSGFGDSLLNSIQNNFSVDRDRVLKLFWGVKEKKGSGSDCIGGVIFKSCAFQLADMFCFIFQMSLKLQKVPSLWTDSIIVAIPKSPKGFKTT